MDPTSSTESMVGSVLDILEQQCFVLKQEMVRLGMSLLLWLPRKR